MATKYIVDNLSGQTITGDLTINGNVIITGTTSSDTFLTYRALLTQTGTIVGTNLGNFNYGLIIGETYTITNYIAGDDFSNIANVTSGLINETGCVFVTTGETPTNWNNGSELTSQGNLIVDVLENTLGYNIYWEQAPFGGQGYYVGYNDTTGPMYNNFPRNFTEVKVQIKYAIEYSTSILPPIGIPGIGNDYAKDTFVFINVFSDPDGSLINNALYYTPVEINVKQTSSLAPVVVYGENVSLYPYGNISIDLFAGGNYVDSFFGNYNEVNNITELVTALNNDANTSYLGTFSVNPNVEEGIILTTTERIKNQFSPNNTLTFEAFND